MSLSTPARPIEGPTEANLRTSDLRHFADSLKKGITPTSGGNSYHSEQTPTPRGLTEKQAESIAGSNSRFPFVSTWERLSPDDRRDVMTSPYSEELILNRKNQPYSLWEGIRSARIPEHDWFDTSDKATSTQQSSAILNKIYENGKKIVTVVLDESEQIESAVHELEEELGDRKMSVDEITYWRNLRSTPRKTLTSEVSLMSLTVVALHNLLGAVLSRLGKKLEMDLSLEPESSYDSSRIDLSILDLVLGRFYFGWELKRKLVLRDAPDMIHCLANHDLQLGLVGTKLKWEWKSNVSSSPDPLLLVGDGPSPDYLAEVSLSPPGPQGLSLPPLTQEPLNIRHSDIHTLEVTNVAPLISQTF